MHPIAMLPKTTQIEMFNWGITDYNPDHPIREAIQAINWVNLCHRASSLNNGLPCKPLSKTTNGLHNLVRILQFSDNTRWIARIHLRRSPTDSAKLRAEVDVMQLIKDQCSLPVPQVFAYEVDENNPISAPFILMEYLLGNTAMDAAGGYEVHKGQIPLAHRQNFYRSVAECHVQIAALRFPKIGIIFRSENGQYDIGPFPDIGGPFSSATSFFEAWGKHAKFPPGKDRILELMRGGPATQVLLAINNFPS
ncbi:hypothetical protein F5Y15DRAFT_375343 [Xylariaceae sp. FL0016]|nr:hypothetical protein F5Y15DRAFT_375343 [Xylariaceae sp. FL0016]